jgi:hypothetical protein
MRDVTELRREIIRLSTALQQQYLDRRERAALEGALDGIMFASSGAAKAPLDTWLPQLVVAHIDQRAAEHLAHLAETPAAAVEPYVSELCDIGYHDRCEVPTCHCRAAAHGAHHNEAA